MDFIGKAEMEKEFTKIVVEVYKQSKVVEDIAKTSFNVEEQSLKV